MADYCGEVLVDPKMSMSNLVGPEAMAHNVYNHILLSPTQVSRNLSLPPNQLSGLVGGRSKLGDRVIENFHSVNTCPKSIPKDDGHRFSSPTTGCIYEENGKEIFGIEESQQNACTTVNSGATCSHSPSKDEGKIPKDVEDGCEMNQDESCSTAQVDADADDDNGIQNVEEFITFHLMNSADSSQTSNEQSPCQESGEQPQCSLNILQNLAQKTEEIIKHNRLLQQQIVKLKKETALQTETLTKLLKKKKKRLRSSTKTKI